MELKTLYVVPNQDITRNTASWTYLDETTKS